MSSGICRSSAPSRRRQPERAVTFLTLPSTRAKELLAAEPSVGEVIYFEHQRLGIARADQSGEASSRCCARAKFQRIWILDRTIRPALAAMLAGIPERIGPGDGLQRRLITNAGHRPAPFPRAGDGLAARAARVDERAGRLDRARPETAGSAARRRSRRAITTPRPWVVLALGGSHPSKDWPDEHWAALLDTLRRRTAGHRVPDRRRGQFGARTDADRALGRRARDQCLRSLDRRGGGAVAPRGPVRRARLRPDESRRRGRDARPSRCSARRRYSSYSRFIHAIEPDGGQSPGRHDAHHPGAGDGADRAVSARRRRSLRLTRRSSPSRSCPGSAPARRA